MPLVKVKHGHYLKFTIIVKNTHIRCDISEIPRYLLIEFEKAEKEQLADNEDLLAVSKRLIAKNREAYEVLAK